MNCNDNQTSDEGCIEQRRQTVKCHLSHLPAAGHDKRGGVEECHHGFHWEYPLVHPRVLLRQHHALEDLHLILDGPQEGMLLAGPILVTLAAFALQDVLNYEPLRKSRRSYLCR